MKKIDIISNKKNEMIDITDNIQSLIKEEKIQEGIITIFVPHTTAGITINEGADPDVKKDIINFLKEKIPKDKNYLHSEGNSDAHIKASIFGSSLNVIIEKNNLVLGTWQHIFFYEGDGPRKRKIFIKILKK